MEEGECRGEQERFLPWRNFSRPQKFCLNIKNKGRCLVKTVHWGLMFLKSEQRASQSQKWLTRGRSDGSLKRPLRICAQIDNLDECQEVSSLFHC